MSTSSNETSTARYIVTGFDKDFSEADLDLDDQGASGKHSAASVNTTSFTESDMIELSSDSEAVIEEPGGPQILQYHPNGAHGVSQFTQPRRSGLLSPYGSNDSSLDTTCQDSDLSTNLLGQYHGLRTEEPATPPEHDCNDFIFGVPARNRRNVPVLSEGDGPPPRSMKYLARLQEKRTHKDLQQIQRSVQLREANDTKKRDPQKLELPGQAVSYEAHEATKNVEETPEKDNKKFYTGVQTNERDEELPRPPNLVAKHQGLRHHAPFSLTNEHKASLKDVAEPINVTHTDAQDAEPIAAFDNKTGKQDRKGYKATRSPGFNVSQRLDVESKKAFERPGRVTNDYQEQHLRQNDSTKSNPPLQSTKARNSYQDKLLSEQDDRRSLQIPSKNLKNDGPRGSPPRRSFCPEPLTSILPNYDILRRLPELSKVKDRRDQLKNHLSDLRRVKSVAEETARYRCMQLDEDKIQDELEEINAFACSVLNGQVFSAAARKRLRDIGDNMRRRVKRGETMISNEDTYYFVQQTQEKLLQTHAARVLQGNAFGEIVGAIPLTEQREKMLRTYRNEELKQIYRKKEGKKPTSFSIARLELLKRSYEAAEETNNSPSPVPADRVIDFNGFSDSDTEISSDEDETPEEYQARKKRTQEARRGEKYKAWMAAHNASIRNGKAKDAEILRHADYEAQELSRGGFNVAKELPPGFDRKRITNEHKQHFDELEALPAGNLTGQGRLPSPAAEASESDNEQEVAAHEADYMIDSDSDSSIIDVAEECFEYIVKGQRSHVGVSPSTENENVYGRYLDGPSAHSCISRLLGRLPLTAADARRGARVVSELSSSDLNLLDQTVTFFNTGKTLRFWVEKRRVYAEGTVKRRAFTPRTLYQVNERRTVTVPSSSDASVLVLADVDELFASPPPPPSSTVTTKAHLPLYTSLLDANFAALEIFLSLCASCCDVPPALWDRQRTTFRSKLTDLVNDNGDDDDPAAVFDEKRLFSELGNAKSTGTGREGMVMDKDVDGKGKGKGKGKRERERRLETVTRTEEVRVWVVGVEVVGPRN